MERNENGLFVTPRSINPSGLGTPTVPREGCEMGRDAIRGGCGAMGNGSCGCNAGEGRQLAMVYAPMQCFRMLYDHSDALMRGTLFEELDKPLTEGMR